MRYWSYSLKRVVEIREELEPYSSTGTVFRAYLTDGTPLYMGAETKSALLNRVLEMYPEVEFVDPS